MNEQFNGVLSFIVDDMTLVSFIELLLVLLFRLEKEPCSLEEVVDDVDSDVTLLLLLVALVVVIITITIAVTVTVISILQSISKR